MMVNSRLMPKEKEGALFMDMLHYVVERITFQDEENGYTVSSAKRRGTHELVTISSA